MNYTMNNRSVQVRLLASLPIILLIHLPWQLLSASTTVTRPELVLQTGHTLAVTSIAFSPDGRFLASGAWDHNVKLWDADSGSEIINYPDHSGIITAVAFSPNGNILASAGTDHKIIVRDISTGTVKLRLSGPGSMHDLLFFSKSGQWLGVGSAEVGVTLWDLITGRELGNFPGRSFAMSADGQWIASAIDATIVITSTATKNERTRINRPGKPLSFSPDGAQLASLNLGRVEIWDLRSGALARDFNVSSEIDPTYCVAVDDSWKYVATGSTLGQITVWSATTGEKLWAGGPDPARLGPTPLRVVSGLAFHSATHVLASANWDDTISYWDIDSGRLLRRSTQRAERLKSALVSPNGHWMANFSVDQGTIVVWDLKGDSGVKKVSPPQGKFAIYSDSEIKPSSIRRMAFGANGQTLATGLSNSIVLWDVASGRELHEFAGHTGNVTSVAFSSDGRWMASGSSDNTARLWDLHSQVEVIALHPASAAGGVEVIGFVGTENPAVVLLDNGHGTMTFWKVPSGVQTSIPGSQVGHADDATVSLDGRWLAVVDAPAQAVRLRDLSNGKEVTIPAASPPVALTLDGRELVVARDHMLQVSRTATGRIIKNIPIKGTLTAATFINNGTMLVVTDSSGLTILYDCRTGETLLTLASSWNTDDWAAIAPDGLFDGSADGFRDLLVWKFFPHASSTTPVEIFLNEFFHPGLVSEVISGGRPRATRPIESIDRRQPRVQITSVSNDLGHTSSSGRSVLVRVSVAEAPPDGQHALGSGVRDVRLFRDGSLVRIWRGEIPLDTRGEAILQTEVQVAVAHSRLTAYAFNREDIKTRDASLQVTTDAFPPVTATAYIVLVGIDKYANPEFDLKYARADATDFATTFEDAQRQLGRFGHIKVVRLLDHSATKANILNALRGLGRERDDVSTGQEVEIPQDRALPAGPADVVFFYFAGHGMAAGPRYYLVPSDLGYAGSRDVLSASGLKSILSRSISDRELQDAFERVDAGTIVFIMDACNSGRALDANETRRGPMNSSGLAQLAYEKGMYVLAAAQGYQAAIETSRFGHGYLTYALVEEGLRNGAADTAPRDGRIDLKEWLNYPVARVPQLQRIVDDQRSIEHPKTQADSGAGVSGRLQDVQRPRLFSRRGSAAADRLIIAQVTQRPSEDSKSSAPTAEMLFKEMYGSYAKFKSSYIVSESTGTQAVPGLPTTTSKSTAISAVSSNGKSRLETSSDNPWLPKRTIVVSDGHYTWTYYGENNSASTSTARYSNSYTKESVVTANTMISAADAVAKLPNLHISREDVIEVEGKKVPCYVVESSSQFTQGGSQTTTKQTWWFDKTRKITLRQDMSINSGTLKSDNSKVTTIARIDEPLDDALFTFTPPPGAKEVPPGSFRQRIALTGIRSPSFKVNDLEDREIDSTTLRDKVVVLTFWASWCLPCQEQLTVLDRVLRDTRNKEDLAVFGVNDEAAGIAARYLGEKRLSISSLVDKGGAVRTSFGAQRIPVTVIVDRAGRFVTRLEGLQDELELRRALKEAGIE